MKSIRIISRKVKYLSKTFFIISIALIMTSCYPGDSITVSEADVVTTFRDDKADFTKYKTYAMPDSVIYITDKGPEKGYDPTIDEWILDAIKRNMADIGFTRGDDPDKVDVIVVSMVTKTTWVSGGCYPWYWDWWSSYPGWCYPYNYSYSVGSVFVSMFNGALKEVDENQEPLWIAGINGILISSPSSERIDKRITQAFTQSPYLKDGK